MHEWSLGGSVRKEAGRVEGGTRNSRVMVRDIEGTGNDNVLRCMKRVGQEVVQKEAESGGIWRKVVRKVNREKRYMCDLNVNAKISLWSHNIIFFLIYKMLFYLLIEFKSVS